MWHADRGRLPLRTPGPVPLGLAYVLLVETTHFSELVIFSDFAVRISLGTLSICFKNQTFSLKFKYCANFILSFSSLRIWVSNFNRIYPSKNCWNSIIYLRNSKKIIMFKFKGFLAHLSRRQQTECIAMTTSMWDEVLLFLVPFKVNFWRVLDVFLD